MAGRGSGVTETRVKFIHSLGVSLMISYSLRHNHSHCKHIKKQQKTEWHSHSGAHASVRIDAVGHTQAYMYHVLQGGLWRLCLGHLDVCTLVSWTKASQNPHISHFLTQQYTHPRMHTHTQAHTHAHRHTHTYMYYTRTM